MFYLFICLQSALCLRLPVILPSVCAYQSFLYCYLEIFGLLSAQISFAKYCSVRALPYGTIFHPFICLQSLCSPSAPTRLLCIDTLRFSLYFLHRSRSPGPVVCARAVFFSNLYLFSHSALSAPTNLFCIDT